MLACLMFGDQRRGDIARYVIRSRELRHRFFRSRLFDEHAWDMLLHLFCALTENETVSEADLICRAGVGETIGRRWLMHLATDGQVGMREDGEDVMLTPEAIERMRGYLDMVEHARGKTH